MEKVEIDKEQLAFVVRVLKDMRMGLIEEEQQIHEELKKVLSRNEIEYKYEYRLGKGSRVDFYCPKVKTAIEVKKGKPNAKRLKNQVERYAGFEEVEQVIVVSERIVRLPGEVNGKPCYTVDLHRLWF